MVMMMMMVMVMMTMMMMVMMLIMMMTEVRPKTCHKAVAFDIFLVSESTFYQQPHSLQMAYDDDDDNDD
eukprot:1992164-Karenia_brevis.AAC.1